MNIELQGENVPYVLKVSKRTKSVRLAIYHNGSFIVTVPENIKHTIVERLISKKSKWVINKLNYFKKFIGRVFVKTSRKEYLVNKERALILVKKQIEYLNQFYNFKYNNIYIKNQKTRWGSCSKSGNLNFNYKIVFLSQKLFDYIIVHEICHLGEFNHSKDFWNLVAKTIPDWKKLRNEIKNMSHSR